MSSDFSVTHGPSSSAPTRSFTLRQDAFCFVVDTDSVPFVLDTGANRIIVNDAKLLQNLQTSTAKVKGIEGKCVRIAGTGTISLPLRSDDGHINMVPNLHAVYVPSCPYNLIPPQILIHQMRKQKYSVKYSEHDDREYIFHYKSPSSPPPPMLLRRPLPFSARTVTARLRPTERTSRGSGSEA